MADTDSPPSPIRQLRDRRGWTLEQLADRIGLKSKGRMSEIERGVTEPSPEVALRLEEISDGLIDAAALSPLIAAARRTPQPA